MIYVTTCSCSGYFSPDYWENSSLQQVLNSGEDHQHLPWRRSHVLPERNRSLSSSKESLLQATDWVIRQSSAFLFRKATEKLANSILNYSQKVLDPCFLFPAREPCTQASCCGCHRQWTCIYSAPAEHPVQHPTPRGTSEMLPVGTCPFIWLLSCMSKSSPIPAQKLVRFFCLFSFFNWKRQFHQYQILTRTLILILSYGNIFMSGIKFWSE